MLTIRAIMALVLATSSLTALASLDPGAMRRIELKGVIEVVNVEMKGGPPSLTVKADDGKQWTVFLGSIRYLIDQNFNPKAGQRMEASGIVYDDGQLVASQVTLPEVRKTVRLRDAEGRPLWRGPHRKAANP